MQIGIYEKALNNKFSWAEKIKIAQIAGYDFIEFSVDESSARLARLDWDDEKINNLKKILIANNFYFNSMALSGLRKFPLGSKDSAIRKKAITLTNKAIILAKKLGIRHIQLAGYDEYYRPSDQTTKANFVASVKQITKLAMEHSVMLTFEIMDTKFLGTISNYFKILKDIKSPWLNIYPDLGNLWRWSQDTIEQELTLGIDKIVALHFKDTKPNLFRDVPFGQGDVDFKRIFKHLKALQYNGPILIEMWSKNAPDETALDNTKQIKAARDFFKKVVGYV